MNEVGEVKGGTLDEIGLGQRLQKARRAAGLTQQTLCQKANISYSTLAKIERGAIKAPSIFTIQSLAIALDSTLDALMGMKPGAGAVGSAAPETGPKSRNGITFVFFDVNGCLVHFFQRAFTALARETQTSADGIEASFWHLNDRACRGEMTIEEFNLEFAKNIGVESIDMMDYYLGAVESVPGMGDLVKWVSENYRIGLLTNILPGFLPALRARGLVPDLPYDVVIDSSEVRAIKPERKIFDIAAEKAGVPVSEILLVDDDRANIMQAERLGWHVLWCDDYHPSDTAMRVRQVLEIV